MIINSDNKSTQTLSEKAIDWLYQIAYFIKYNKWLKIEREKRIKDDSKQQIKDNLVGQLYHNIYNNKQ